MNLCSITSPPGQIIHLHTVENVHTTKFIDVYINDQHITAFIDSGASHCLMSENMFQTLQQSHGDLKLSGTHDGQQIDTAGDSSLKIIGHFVAKMVFNGRARNKPTRVSIKNKIYVVRHLRMPFILGADILYSPSCISLSHSQIIFKHEEGDIIIPTSTTKDSKLHVMHSSTQDCVIKPFTLSQIPLQVCNDKLSLRKGSYNLRCTELLPHSGLESLDDVVEVHNPESITMTVANNTDDWLAIPPDLHLADISFRRQDLHHVAAAQVSVADSNKAPLPTVSEIVESGMKVTELCHNDIAISKANILDLIDLSNIPPQYVERYKSVIQKHVSAFTADRYGTGCIQGFEANLILKDPTANAIAKRRQIPGPLKQEVQTMLDAYEARGLISELPRNEPTKFVTNIVFVRKKDSLGRPLSDSNGIGIFRMCLDFRQLNNLLEPEAVPSSSLDSLIYEFEGCTIYTVLDLANSFYSIRLSKESQKLTCFYGVDGRIYFWNVLSMGIKTAVAILGRGLDFALHMPFNNFVLFVDDSCMGAKNTDQHLERFEYILRQCEKHGVKINIKKFKAYTHHVQFLGFHVENGLVSIPNHKREMVAQIPIPSSRPQLVHFFFALSYFRRFIPDFGEVTAKLRPLLSPKTKFKMSEEEIQAFNNVKEAVAKSLELHPPDWRKKFFLYSDASTVAIGNVLTQQGENGQEYPISTYSRSFSKTELNKSVFEKEALALLHGLIQSRPLIQGAPIVAYVDARALLFLRLMNSGSPYVRMSLALSEFDLQIVHVTGQDNTVCDSLSRMFEGDKPTLKPLAKSDCVSLLHRMTFDDGFSITPADVRQLLLQGTVWPSPSDKLKSVLKSSKPRIIHPNSIKSHLNLIMEKNRVNKRKRKSRSPSVALANLRHHPRNNTFDLETTDSHPDRIVPWQNIPSLADVFPQFSHQPISTTESLLPIISSKLRLYLGCITTLATDVVVNAANSSLLGGGGVDGAIHRKAGPQLLSECKRLNYCEQGDVKVTQAYGLPALFIFHTVGPQDKDAHTLKSCYSKCFSLLLKYKLRSIVFPSISTGAYGYPISEAAPVAFQAVFDFLRCNHSEIDTVIFCLFTKDDYEFYKDFFFKTCDSLFHSSLPSLDCSSVNGASSTHTESTVADAPVVALSTLAGSNESAVESTAADRSPFSDFLQRITITKHGLISDELFAAMQAKDDYCMSHKDDPRFFTEPGGIFYLRSSPCSKPVLPAVLLPDLLTYCHGFIHLSAKAMARKMSQYFHVPSVDSVSHDFVKRCTVCAFIAVPFARRIPYSSMIEPEEVRELWAGDIAPNLMPENRRHLVVFVEAMSLYTVGTMVEDMTAATLSKAFADLVLIPFGRPLRFRSDQQFSSKEFTAFLSANTVTFEPCAPHAPWNNLAETSIRKCKKAAKALYKIFQKDFEKHLPKLFEELNHVPSSSSLLSPVEIMFGRENKSFPLLSTAPRFSPADLDSLLALQRERRANKKLSHMDKINREKIERDFQPGDIIVFRNVNVQKNPLLHNTLMGPALITSMKHENRATVLMLEPPFRTYDVHKTYIFHFNGCSSFPSAYFDDFFARRTLNTITE